MTNFSSLVMPAPRIEVAVKVVMGVSLDEPSLQWLALRYLSLTVPVLTALDVAVSVAVMMNRDHRSWRTTTAQPTPPHQDATMARVKCLWETGRTSKVVGHVAPK